MLVFGQSAGVGLLASRGRVEVGSAELVGGPKVVFTHELVTANRLPAQVRRCGKSKPAPETHRKGSSQ